MIDGEIAGDRDDGISDPHRGFENPRVVVDVVAGISK